LVSRTLFLSATQLLIDSVTNPLDQITAAIRVDGGDFFAVPA
jgi:hypothetical protein